MKFWKLNKNNCLAVIKDTGKMPNYYFEVTSMNYFWVLWSEVLTERQFTSQTISFLKSCIIIIFEILIRSGLNKFIIIDISDKHMGYWKT